MAEFRNTRMARAWIALAALTVVGLIAWLGVASVGTPHPGLDVTLERMAWDSSPDSITFAVVGDAGKGNAGQFRVANRMALEYQQRPFGYLLTVGDNVYGGSVIDQAPEVIEKPYRALFDAAVAFRPTLGNHDVGGGADLRETLDTLGMPDRYYRFSAGPVDFFALDSNWMDADQVRWLREGLACSTSHWQVVYMHHPIYSAGRHGSDLGLRDRLEKVFAAGGVDIVLAGHDHDYQRSLPQDGIVYVVSGGGSSPRRVGSADFTAVSESVLHFLFVQATGERMRVEAVDVDGDVIDAFSVSPRPALAPCEQGPA